MKAKIFLYFLCIISLFGSCFSMDIPNYEGFINDKIGLLNQQEKSDLENLAKDIANKTSAEISVLLVDTIDGDDINLVANEVGNKRGVGKKDTNNGIIILVALNDRQWSIQVGYGLEGTIPDLIAKRIGEGKLTPNFKKGQYYAGLKETLQDISMYINGDLVLSNNMDRNIKEFDRQKSIIGLPFLLLMISISLGRIFNSFFVEKRGGKRYITKKGIKILLILRFIFFILLFFLSYKILLSLLISIISMSLATVIAFYGDKNLLRMQGGTPYKGGGFGGGGSFGGFGGGSFGGGGASGKW